MSACKKFNPHGLYLNETVMQSPHKVKEAVPNVEATPLKATPLKLTHLKV